MLSTIARIIKEAFDNLNNLFATTKMPPRTYTTVAKRKYAPMGKENEIARMIGTCPPRHQKRINQRCDLC